MFSCTDAFLLNKFPVLFVGSSTYNISLIVLFLYAKLAVTVPKILMFPAGLINFLVVGCSFLSTNLGKSFVINYSHVCTSVDFEHSVCVPSMFMSTFHTFEYLFELHSPKKMLQALVSSSQVPQKLLSSFASSERVCTRFFLRRPAYISKMVKLFTIVALFSPGWAFVGIVR